MNGHNASISPSGPHASTLPILSHLLHAYREWHEFIPHIPKVNRYSLGVKIDTLFIETAEFMFRAAQAGPQEKPTLLSSASAKLDLLKWMLQLLWEIKGLDSKKYAALAERLFEIGKMLGGWKRQAGSKTPPQKSGEKDGDLRTARNR